MIAMDYTDTFRYISPDGYQFIWARELSWICPHMSGDVVTAPVGVMEALEGHGLDPVTLFRNAHRRGTTKTIYTGFSRRCAACGAKARRKGYYYQVRRPATAEEILANPNLRLETTVAQGVMVVDEEGFFPTKVAAEAWARTQAEKRGWTEGPIGLKTAKVAS